MYTLTHSRLHAFVLLPVLHGLPPPSQGSPVYVSIWHYHHLTRLQTTWIGELEGILLLCMLESILFSSSFLRPHQPLTLCEQLLVLPGLHLLRLCQVLCVRHGQDLLHVLSLL
jgi:hypothetical protein